MPVYTLREVAELLQAELHGNGGYEVNGIATLKSAATNQLSFISEARYRSHLAESQAGGVILRAEDLEYWSGNALVVSNPYLSYAKAASLFQKLPNDGSGQHASAVIDPSSEVHPTASIGANAVIAAGVVIGPGVSIGPGCFIGAESRIGEGSRLWANVTIYHHVTLGCHVTVHSGTVIGSDGFGFANEQGTWHKIPQLGGVIIGDRVEIGANTTIDRGALDDTVIEAGVILDNQIQIAHNVRIGQNTAIAGCVGIAGGAIIGRNCRIGGGCAIAGHLTIADNVVLTGRSNVSHSILKSGMYSSGIPVQDSRSWRRNVARIYQLDDLAKRLKILEKNIQVPTNE